ncbi:MAG: YchJ family protein [Desulfuromonadales bacterium]|nr:MAG: YchJ family protein [Desulfuromonadales bacterium]
MEDLCPCGTGASYADCCQPLISGARKAITAAELMRSRYTAYTKVETGYIRETTHPDHRKDFDEEGTRQWAENSRWEGLEILAAVAGGADDTEGKVEFIARYRDPDVRRTHHELADFRKLDGDWYFVDGVGVKPQPASSTKVGRNDPCTCGSGQKYKKCCGK